ncbi:hypothetical protein H9Q69_011074 [Fusarium xylarioides]|nr:hypothetical protein H9Q69_011074 [Fusarium xylarioides]
MSEGNIYCALCRAPVGHYELQVTVPYNESIHNLMNQRQTAHNIDTSWMEDFMIIARDPKSQETFLIKEAVHQKGNCFDVSGDDEVEEYGETFKDKLITVYDLQGPQSFAAPFHNECYEVLLDVSKSDKVNLPALYDTLAAHCPPSTGNNSNRRQPRSLKCSYYHALKFFEADHIVPGQEFGLAPPAARPEDGDIENLVTKLVRASQINSRNIKRIPRKPYSPNHYGREAFEKTWEAKVYSDMPWASCFLPPVQTLDHHNVSWAMLHNTLEQLGKGKGPGSFTTKMQIQNRRRVWTVCSRILKECSTRMQKQDQEINKADKNSATAMEKVQMGAVPGPMPLLTFPAEPETTYATVSLFNDLSDLEEAEPVIRVYWTAGKELAGLGVYDPKTNTTKNIGSEDLFDSSEDAKIPQHAWLGGLSITAKETPSKTCPGTMRQKIVGIKFLFHFGEFIQLGESEGDIRLLLSEPKKTVVSIGASWAPGKPLEKLGLLQKRPGSVPELRIRRYQEKKALFCVSGTEFDPDFDITNFLWSGQVPVEPSIWPPYPLGPDPLMPEPVEALIFDRPCNRPECQIVIGVDVQFRGFEVTHKYFDKTTRKSIGITTAMQYFVLGPEDSLKKCYVTGEHKIEGLRFVTTNGRHFIVGRPGPDETLFANGGKEGETIQGFHCRWSNKSAQDSVLTLFGVFTLDDPRYDLNGEEDEFEEVDEVDQIYKDCRGRYWTGRPPLRMDFLYTEIGPVYGKVDTMARLRYPGVGVPTRIAVVTWLDCSKPLESIHVALCHRTTSDLLPLVSVTLHYANANENPPMSIGPTLISLPDDEKEITGHPKCACIYGGSYPQEVQQRPHYSTETWQVYGAYLKTLRLWTNDIGVLTGLQFIAEGDSESPRWGLCKGEHSAELDLQVKERSKPGIKFFLDSNGRNHVSEDIVVVSLQLILWQQAMKRDYGEPINKKPR